MYTHPYQTVNEPRFSEWVTPIFLCLRSDSFTTYVRGNPLANILMNLISPNTGYVALLSYEDGIILRTFVLTQYRHVTDGQKCYIANTTRGTAPRCENVNVPFHFSFLSFPPSLTYYSRKEGRELGNGRRADEKKVREMCSPLSQQTLAVET